LQTHGVATSNQHHRRFSQKAGKFRVQHGRHEHQVGLDSVQDVLNVGCGRKWRKWNDRRALREAFQMKQCRTQTVRQKDDDTPSAERGQLRSDLGKRGANF